MGSIDEMMNKQINQQQAMRYSRQILLPGFDLERQEALMNASVLQIGVGGLGCASAQYLVAAGIGAITLVDDDRVELTNLQRQVLHGEQDIGKSKCASAKTSLVTLNSEVDIQTIEARLEGNALGQAIEQHDIVLDCSDNLDTRNEINRLCLVKQKPLVSGAAIRMEGQVICFQPAADEPCYRCLSQFFGEQNLSCVESGIMSPVVGVIGAMQALEAIKILTAYGQASIGRLMLFDGMTSSWSNFKVPKQPTCPDCSVKLT
ncbi:MAG: molybdopterin/thiamine biosynthesis adenylyltransferase [Paraglaciecola sp.]|jgi:molybdopterin/thiamine biosynthesis adenylyltransferase